MALAAMDSSESVELPLDYLQGYKDGLEWAARLAEANHPDTGDWLYDDPIELAKAIRKGPDMPPVQPVADSEPDRNPVLAYADSYRDMAKQGVESVPIWSVITDLERNIAPLYRHAQPVPVVPKSISVRQAISALESAGAVTTIGQAYKMGWNACRAAMLQELKKSAGAEAICRSDENVQVLHTKSPAQSDCCPAQNVVAPAQSPIDHGYLPECECAGCKATARICTEMAVNSLVIPDEMTSGQAYEIGYYYGDPVDVFARGANWMRQHIIDSTLAAAPQSPGSDPATVPGKWISVSERMPENDGAYLCWDNRYVTTYAFIFGAWQANQFIAKNITHWMPLPAGPQEVR
ncbi:DUF551 domain-containing protein [Klebsiella pneumoniae]|nr:DUF551 domain-containing protein [Klebsiella pneumoniae]MCF7049434.1 DUF551 domain-containing protein [Klebsiella pneumoniae]MCM2238982.1 DUF551 domain-containing protein [Klebsiella pneumoniae]